MDRSCSCVICGDTFMRKTFAGNYQARYKICDKCNQWHKWCPYGKHAPLLSRFSPSGSVGGRQHICNDCLPRLRGRRIYRCISCQVEFIQPERQQRLNGQGEPLCDDCYLNVKHCKRCDTVKQRSDFGIALDKANGLSAFCRDCLRESWHLLPARRRALPKLAKFGLTYEQYMAMREACGDLCTICRQPETSLHQNGKVRLLAIDHCHTTGRVRGLICQACNHALGHMRDDPARLRAAADYLETFSLISDATTDYDPGGLNARL